MATTIGIDPGKATGIAIYRDAALCELRTVRPEQVEAVPSCEGSGVLSSGDVHARG